jgi:hypothetical protein
MPRQIIDTESSRPAYRRRLTVRWVIIAFLIVLAFLAAWHFWQAIPHPIPNPGPGSNQ